MARINDNYLRLKSSYLFTEIARRVKEFQAAHPQAKLIRLGIGDVTQPLSPGIIRALHDAVDDPVYPVYVDSNVMAGRGGPPDDAGRYAGLVYLPCIASNNFLPKLPD